MNLTVIIPTKDRPQKIKKLLNYLKINKFFFNEILIIDSSNYKNKKKLKEIINKLSLNHKLITSAPSIAKQRNLGLKKMNKKNRYFMFLDDDISFKKNSLRKMKKFILCNSLYQGYTFNLRTSNSNTFLDNLKKSNLSRKLGLYNKSVGSISPSGWQTKIEIVKKNTEVDWLPCAATVYKKSKKIIYFDEFFSDYSYLEDLDFSFRKKKLGKLIIVKDAIYKHTNFIERKSINFGIKEIINRYYFVKKNKFNLNIFYFGSILKITLNLVNFKLYRFFGNLIGLFQTLLNLLFDKKL